MSKHTPGPWKIDRGFVVAQHPDKKHLLTIASVMLNENDANLTLIAAAPNLLEACKWAFTQLKGQVRGYAVGTDMIHKRETVKKLEQAITKAEGKHLKV